MTQLAIDRELTLIAWEAMNHWTKEGNFSVHVFHKNNELAGYCSVLHAVRPAPHHLAAAHRLKVFGQRLGQQQHVAVGEQLVAGSQAADQRPELLVGEAEALAVAVLEEHPLPQTCVDPLHVRGVDRQPAFVLLARGGDHADGQLIHPTSLRARRL